MPCNQLPRLSSEGVNIKPRGREMRSKLTISGNGSSVGSDSYGEEGKDLGEEVHDVVDVKGGAEEVEEDGGRQTMRAGARYLNSFEAVAYVTREPL